MSKYEYYKGKYPLIKSSDSVATFLVPKEFGWSSFIALTLLLNVFGLIGYLIYHGSQPDYHEETVPKRE